MGVLEGKKAAFVFPGQGSQSVDMGRDFYDNSEIGKEFFKKADEVLGTSLMDLCFNGPLEVLSKTTNTQPALYTVSAIAFKILSDYAKPFVCAGHSAGEYAALFAAGAFGFEEGLKLISKRASLMNEIAEANPGSMAAVMNLSIEKIKEINEKISGVCVAANINTPVQIVVSGEKEAVEEAAALYKEAGAKRVIPLNVSGAFHSPLMAEAGIKLGEVLTHTDISKLSVPVIANVTAEAETEPDEIRKNLQAQITGSVEWVKSCEKMVEMGTEVFVELGSGNVLAGLIKKICPDIPVYGISSMEDLKEVIG